jgi:U5 snRNP protein, DIM1 family
MLPHLRTAWDVDRTIVLEEKRVVVIRFGREDTAECMRMDDTLASIGEKVKMFAAVYLVDTREVPEFNEMYELFDEDFCVMFFFRNRHIMVDCGTGNNNKITFRITKDDLVDMIETVYRGARKGRGLVVSVKDFSTKGRY